MHLWSVAINAALQEGKYEEVATILKQNPNIIAIECSPPWLNLAIAAPRNQHILLNLFLDAGASLDATDELGATALLVAAGKQQRDCLEELLKRGASVNAFDKKRKTALHYAAHSNSSECLILLLANGCIRDIIDSEGWTPLHIAAREGSLEVVKALLLHGASPMVQDNKKRTPLHLARVPEVAKVLVKAGADVTTPDTQGHTPLSNAVDRRPAMVPQLLNSGVTVHGNIHDTKVKVFFNLDILKSSGTVALEEMYLLKTIAHRGQYELLKHPLCEIFLHLKWLRVYPVFVVKILMFFGLTISLTVNVCLHADFPYNGESNSTSSVFDQFSSVCNGKFWSKYLLIFFLTMITIRQFIKLILFQCNSYNILRNWLEISLIICTMIVCSTVCDKEYFRRWYHHFSVITVLQAWLQMTVLVGHIPLIGIYVHLFKKVSFRMFWFGLVFLSPLVGFAVSFHLLFDHESFHLLPTALLKTLSMMVGELDMDTFIGDDNKTVLTITSQLVLMIFILLMTVVTTNLLMGLAISDITEMLKKAGVQRLALTVEHEEHVDIILYHPLVSRVLPHVFVTWLRQKCSLLENIPGHPMPLNIHNPWLSIYDTLKSGNLRGITKEKYNVMVYPNSQVNPGCVYKSSNSSPPIPTSYELPIWIVANIRLLMTSLLKNEKKRCQKCRKNLHCSCNNQDIHKQIYDLQSTANQDIKKQIFDLQSAANQDIHKQISKLQSVMSQLLQSKN